MSARYLLSPRAQSDIEEIWNYTVKQWDTEQAEAYLRQMQYHIEILAAHPQLGSDCSYIRAGYYKYPSGSHILFFRLEKNGIHIMRILHQQMDFDLHLPS